MEKKLDKDYPVTFDYSKYTAEQVDAITHKGGNVIVSASAGSGKTTVMIERLIRLICLGEADVTQILACTFTEASAADIKEKLNKAISEKIASGATFLSEQLALVPSADISTLHGFCAKLLRNYFFAVGIAPDFKIADEDQSSLIRNESLDKTFKEFYATKDKDFLTILERYKRSRSDAFFREHVLSCYNYCVSEANPKEFLDKTVGLYSQENYGILKAEYKNKLDDHLRLYKAQAEKAHEGFTETEREKAVEFLDYLIPKIEELLAADLYAVTKVDLSTHPAAKIGKSFSEEELYYKDMLSFANDGYKDVVKRFAKHLDTEERDRQSFEEIGKHLVSFIKVLNEFEKNYAAAKAEENVLDFNDLEHLALLALQDERVISDIKNKFKYIFVDEYQDINGVQESIISTISKDNLFMVGDVKQSIYGFRGCRPEIFDQKFERMEKGGEKAILLNSNFRSSSKVIEMVNDIFCYSMTKKWADLDYAGKAELICGSYNLKPEEVAKFGENAALGRATLHLLNTSVPKPDKKDKSKKDDKPKAQVYDILQEIKTDNQDDVPPIAALIAEIIREETEEKRYFNLKKRESMPVKFSDIAILSRTKDSTYVSNLVKGLHKLNVPVSSEVKENVCDFPEILTLINALKLIDNFKQSVPLVATLKSPLGGFSEEELAAVAIFYLDYVEAHCDENMRHGGFCEAFFYYLENADTPLKDRLKEFYEYFNSVRELADFTGAYGGLDKLIKDKEYENYLLCTEMGKAKAKRLHAFLSIADRGERYTVREFLKKIETGKDAFLITPNPQEESVKVMTIHASKGLEFPVVIVCGLECNASVRDEAKEIFLDREYGLAPKFYDDKSKVVSETLVRGVVQERIKENRLKEELRLFYVATTRAAFSLHLTFEGDGDSRREEFLGASKFLDYVPKNLGVKEWGIKELSFTMEKAPRRKILVAKGDARHAEIMNENFNAYKYPYQAETKLFLKNSVTAAVKEAAEEFYPTHVIFPEEPSPDKDGGNTAHKLLEHYDFISGAPFSEQVNGLIKSGVLLKADCDRINLSRIEKAISTSGLLDLVGYEFYREHDFIASVEASSVFKTDSKEKVLLQGIVDLLAVKGSTAIIVDYKYSSLDAESLKRRYKKQLDLYEQAVNKLPNLRVEKKVLINLYTGAVVLL